MSARPSPLLEILEYQGLEVPESLARGLAHEIDSGPAPSLQEALVQHGLALTYGTLLDQGGRGTPAADLSEYRRSATARVLGLRSLLARLSEDLEDAGIPYLVLKGPILAEELYAGSSSRDYIDLDLYVAPEDDEAAKRVLQEAGADRVEPQDRWEEPPWHTSWENGSSRKIELHTDLTRPSVPWPPSFRDLHDRRRHVTVDGTRYPTLGVEDTYLYLLLHGLRHRWSRLLWIEDVKRFADAHDRAVMAAAVEEARETGVGARAGFSVEHLRSFGIPGPETPGFGLGTERHRRLSEYCLRRLAETQVEESPWERLQVDYALADAKAAFLGRKARGFLRHVVADRFLSRTSPGT